MWPVHYQWTGTSPQPGGWGPLQNSAFKWSGSPFRRDKSLTAVLQLFLLRSGLFLTQNRVNICLQSPAVDFTRAISRSIKQTRASERRPIKERLQKPLIKTANYKEDVSEHRKGWRQRQGQNIQKFKRWQAAAASVQGDAQPGLASTWRCRPMNSAGRHRHGARSPVLPDAKVFEKGALITSEVCLWNARGACWWETHTGTKIRAKQSRGVWLVRAWKRLWHGGMDRCKKSSSSPSLVSTAGSVEGSAECRNTVLYASSHTSAGPSTRLRKKKKTGLFIQANWPELAPRARCTFSLNEPVNCTPTAARGCQREKQPKKMSLWKGEKISLSPDVDAASVGFSRST